MLITPANAGPTHTLTHNTSTMTKVFKHTKVSVEFTAIQLEFLHFCLCNERQRILRESPDAFTNPGSYAENIEDLWGLITAQRDANLT